ncbi:hypothetical protein B0A55_00874 [Friedmanniomyces simplex]|uniref:Uncharacterized protein n=1 Tax=Friedmanniomyces simplex TaxID=329884 RepID=A0A4V5NIH9_9PEZI|nr:hypothetical protein B0A55_00874 [Friedmanniomyces simplex]
MPDSPTGQVAFTIPRKFDEAALQSLEPAHRMKILQQRACRINELICGIGDAEALSRAAWQNEKTRESAKKRASKGDSSTTGGTPSEDRSEKRRRASSVSPVAAPETRDATPPAPARPLTRLRLRKRSSLTPDALSGLRELPQRELEDGIGVRMEGREDMPTPTASARPESPEQRDPATLNEQAATADQQTGRSRTMKKEPAFQGKPLVDLSESDDDMKPQIKPESPNAAGLGGSSSAQTPPSQPAAERTEDDRAASRNQEDLKLRIRLMDLAHQKAELELELLRSMPL